MFSVFNGKNNNNTLMFGLLTPLLIEGKHTPNMVDDQGLCVFFFLQYRRNPPEFYQGQVSLFLVFSEMLDWTELRLSHLLWKTEAAYALKFLAVVLSLLCRWQPVLCTLGLVCHSLCLCSLTVLVSVPKTPLQAPWLSSVLAPFFLSPFTAFSELCCPMFLLSWRLHCSFLDCHQFREQWTLRTCASIQSSPQQSPPQHPGHSVGVFLWEWDLEDLRPK